MATVAGDEITETIMKQYLVDFSTAENIKAQLDHQDEIKFSNILGIEQTISKTEIFKSIRGTLEALSKDIADKVIEINGTAPSALFLVGGGCKLSGLKEGVTDALGMDSNRVTIAGNYFLSSAFSEEYDLNNPEYATPIGIVISSGLNLINDSFRVTLNNKPAKLFRSGSFTALNLLMMNGYTFRDIMGRPGLNLAVTVNGSRKVFFGTASEPAALFINQKEGKLSDVIHAGDDIEFIPAIQGESAKASLSDIEGIDEHSDFTLNGKHAALHTELKNGDVIVINWPKTAKIQTKKEISEAEEEIPINPDHLDSFEEEISEEELYSEEEEPVTEQVENEQEEQEQVLTAEKEAEESKETLIPEEPALQDDNRPNIPEETIFFELNDSPLNLPKKSDGRPYYLMDLIQYSGINLEHPKGQVRLTVNGEEGRFQQVLREGDQIVIEDDQR